MTPICKRIIWYTLLVYHKYNEDVYTFTAKIFNATSVILCFHF